MERLTKPDSDYCHDRCGSVNGCTRLTDGKKRCRDYDLYERLKWYEDRYPTPEMVLINLGLISKEEVAKNNGLLKEEQGCLVEFNPDDYKAQVEPW